MQHFAKLPSKDEKNRVPRSSTLIKNNKLPSETVTGTKGVASQEHLIRSSKLFKAFIFDAD